MNLYLGTPPAGSARPVLTTFAGQTGAALSFAVKTTAGAAFVMTGYKAYLFARVGGTYTINGSLMTTTSAANGTLSFTPTGTQMTTAGRYECQVRVVADSDGAATLSEPFIIDAQDQVVGSAPSPEWTEIRVYGKKYTTPAVYYWNVEVYTAAAEIAASRVYFRKTPVTSGSFYNSMISPCYVFTTTYGVLSRLWTGNSQVQQLFNLVLENVTLASGEFIPTYDTGITIDTNDFTTSGEWLYFTPSTLTGEATVAAAPGATDDDEYDLESV